MILQQNEYQCDDGSIVSEPAARLRECDDDSNVSEPAARLRECDDDSTVNFQKNVRIA